MVDNNIYCKVSGMAVQAICLLNSEGSPRPTVIEIGVADGQGTMRYAGLCGKVIGIDPMVSNRPDIVSYEFSNMTPDESKIQDFTRRNLEFPVELIIGCSAWPETVSTVREKIGMGNSVDLLIIDGCHHPFEAVWKDFELYSPMVRPGGYIILDDLYEECVLEAYTKAISDFGYRPVDRWGINNSKILQDVGLLKKETLT